MFLPTLAHVFGLGLASVPSAVLGQILAQPNSTLLNQAMGSHLDNRWYYPVTK